MKNLKKLATKEVKTIKNIQGGHGGRQIDDLLVMIGGPTYNP